MVGEERRGKNERRNHRPLNYFYLPVAGENGKTVLLLHKKLVINNPADTITTWCYPTGKRVAYAYSDVKLRMRPAFTTKEVARLLNRNKITLERAMDAGMVERPQFTYTIDEHRRKYKYMWSEEDVLAMHEYFLTVHYGRPRHDGIIRPKPMPSARELRALMNNDELLYIKEGEEYRPVWRAK